MNKKGITNLEEFEALIKKYRSITLEEITAPPNIIHVALHGDSTARRLTGFGDKDTCILCKKSKCEGCVYGVLHTFCNSTKSRSNITFNAIRFSKTPEKLLEAFRNRADYMENLLIKNDLKK